MNIILADESDLVRSRLRDLLHEIPAITIIAEATNTNQALDFARQHQPDLMLMNFQMPGENGLETLRMIKKLPFPPCMIILTNHASPEYVSSCRDAGADYVFDKAMDIEKLQNLLRDLTQS